MMAIEHKRVLTNKHNELCEEMMPHFLLQPLQKKGYINIAKDKPNKRHQSQC